MGDRSRHERINGDAIRALRDAMGWSVSHAARAAGVGRNTWVRAEKNFDATTQQTRDAIGRVLDLQRIRDPGGIVAKWATLDRHDKATTIRELAHHIATEIEGEDYGG